MAGKAVARKVVKAVAAEATVAAMVAAKAKREAVAGKAVEWKVAVVRKADGGGGGEGGAGGGGCVTLAEKTVGGKWIRRCGAKEVVALEAETMEEANAASGEGGGGDEWPSATVGARAADRFKSLNDACQRGHVL